MAFQLASIRFLLQNVMDFHRFFIDFPWFSSISRRKTRSSLASGMREGFRKTCTESVAWALGMSCTVRLVMPSSSGKISEPLKGTWRLRDASKEL